MKRAGHILRHLICGLFVLSFFSSFLNADLNNGLVAWYPFDGNASDMSGNGKHGTVHGATLVADRHGHANKAYSFDGVNDYISMIIATNNDLTFSAWIKIDSFSNQYPKVFDLGSSYPFFRIGFAGNTNSNVTAGIVGKMDSLSTTAAGTHGSILSYGIQPTNTWLNVVSSLGVSSNHTTYLNGQLVQQSNYTYTPSSTGNLKIGTDFAMGASHFFNGSIDGIRIYNRALSTAEVLALYNLEKPKISLTDSNFQTAVNLWFSDEANANATYGHISDWNTSGVTNMANAFKDRSTFNEDISGWDVSSVTNLSGIFWNATIFNQPLEDWNISSASTTWNMFSGAAEFNHPISDWDTSSVLNMRAMFHGAVSFNQPVGDWNTSSVTNMGCLFEEASSFNHPIDNWNVSSVTDMWRMFLGATSFNQNISDWDVNAVITMGSIFNGGQKGWNRGFTYILSGIGIILSPIRIAYETIKLIIWSLRVKNTKTFLIKKF